MTYDLSDQLVTTNTPGAAVALRACAGGTAGGGLVAE